MQARTRDGGGLPPGTEGRVLSMAGRLEPFDASPRSFVDRACEGGFTAVTLNVILAVNADIDWSVDFTIRRVATVPEGWPGIESRVDGFYCLHYWPGEQGHYTIVPDLPGLRLRPPEGCPENHRERVVAAFLRANHDLFRSASRRGLRFRVKTVVTFGGKTIATPSYLRLRWLGRGYRSDAFAPDDRQSMREAYRLLFGSRGPENPKPRLVPPEE